MSGIQKLLFVVAVFVLGSHFSIARAQERADLLLVLAADISYSIDAPSFKMQRAGYAQAITDPQVINAIHGGPIGRIAVCYVEWSGETAQKLVVDWTLIADSDDAHKFAARIVEAPRSFSDRTSISGAIAFATDLLERAPYAAANRILDVSGNGVNNAGRGTALVREEALAKGITINGLVIPSEPRGDPEEPNSPGELEDYYRHEVIAGSRAFVVVATDFRTFDQAMVRKLSTEIAQVGQGQHAALR